MKIASIRSQYQLIDWVVIQGNWEYLPAPPG